MPPKPAISVRSLASRVMKVHVEFGGQDHTAQWVPQVSSVQVVRSAAAKIHSHDTINLIEANRALRGDRQFAGPMTAAMEAPETN